MQPTIGWFTNSPSSTQRPAHEKNFGSLDHLDTKPHVNKKNPQSSSSTVQYPYMADAGRSSLIQSFKWYCRHSGCGHVDYRVWQVQNHQHRYGRPQFLVLFTRCFVGRFLLCRHCCSCSSMTTFFGLADMGVMLVQRRWCIERKFSNATATSLTAPRLRTTIVVNSFGCHPDTERTHFATMKPTGHSTSARSCLLYSSLSLT